MADPASDIAFWHPGWPMADWASGSIAAVILNSCQPFRLQARAAALAGIAALYHIETGSRDNSADHRRSVIPSLKNSNLACQKANTSGVPVTTIPTRAGWSQGLCARRGVSSQ